MQAIEHNAGTAAELLLDAAFAGLASQAGKLYILLEEMMHTESDFFSSVKALRHLLYLYLYDRVLKTAGLPPLARIIHLCWERSLCLLESLGQISGKDPQLLDAIKTLVETFEGCSHLENSPYDYSREEFLQVLTRISNDANLWPTISGATTGALWILDGADAEKVLSQMKLFVDPSQLGDFLSGLFCLAREPAQRQQKLLQAIDALVSSYNDDQYLIALPALRLAFAYFTPREKHQLACSLDQLWQVKTAANLTSSPIPIDPKAVTCAIAFEEQLFAAIEKYGLRGAIKVEEQA
jgi:hypothetical protein